jgi:transcriptional regulator with XRE-family HTH domain
MHNDNKDKTAARALGRRIAEARRAANLTQVELAAKLEWPVDTIINYENGRRAITVERLTTIAAVLGRPAAVLLMDDPGIAQLVTRLAGDAEIRAQVAFFLDALDASPPKA